MGFSGVGLKRESSVDIVLKGLKSLEYRGYDSSGIAYYDGTEKKIKCVKKSGKLINLKAEFGCEKPIKSSIAIGHIRWATHGKPTDENAHPHLDCSGNIAIVHNGIIENYSALKDALLKKGHRFATPTDSEVIAHLIEDYVNEGKTFYEAVRLSALELSGAFAVLALSAREKSIAAFKSGPPLVFAQNGDDIYFASDVSPLMEYSGEVVYLKNNEIAYFREKKLEMTTFKGRKTDKTVTKIDRNASSSIKDGFSHFMQKEIFEQPARLLDAFSSRIVSADGAAAVRGGSKKVVKFDKINKNGLFSFPGLKIHLENVRLTRKDIENAGRIVIAACGSSYYAGLAVKYMVETVCGIPVIVEYGSELRYENFPVSKNDIFLGISQSGETADTNSALETARAKHAGILSITNMPGSQLTEMSDKGVIYTHAGPEIGVASTKAFTSQLLCGLLLALYIRELTGFNPKAAGAARAASGAAGVKRRDIFKDMVELPEKVGQILSMDEAIKEIAKKYYKSSNFLYLGRGILYPIALEGALKLKEISYIHAEGYAAGELKHGPIALVDNDMPVIVLAPHDNVFDKTLSNMQEVAARGGRLILITDAAASHDFGGEVEMIAMPEMAPDFSAIVYAVPVQMIAYHTAIFMGKAADQPRNLAKSVTVE